MAGWEVGSVIATEYVEKVPAASPRPSRQYRVGRAEFLGLIAALSALNAIAIDVMLPAFGEIRSAFGLAPDATEVSLLVTAYLVGLGLGQYFYGPIADAFGRKLVLYVGVILYLVGAAGVITSQTLETMIIMRFVWGLGAAGPRVVSMAIVRDRYSGDEMARVMSTVMAVFMIVPAIAPSIGKLALSFGSWRYPFLVSATFGLSVGLWAIRLRETLPPEYRLPLNFRNTMSATVEVFRHRATAGMMIGLTFMLGAFVPYLGSGQLIYAVVYDRAEQFPYWFGLAAAFMGLASTANSRVVRHLGSRKTLAWSMSGYLLIGILFVVTSIATAGRPPFALFYGLTTALIVTHIASSALMNSLAMEDVGHIAGTASAVIGTVSTVGGSILGSVIDRFVTDSVTPFAMGFLIYGSIGATLVLWSSRPRATSQVVGV
jgi:DHA1 family bicyclomycin/chloramphenicol resistance-like MFS transporter